MAGERVGPEYMIEADCGGLVKLGPAQLIASNGSVEDYMRHKGVSFHEACNVIGRIWWPQAGQQPDALNR
jgi:hypothetical protein